MLNFDLEMESKSISDHDTQERLHATDDRRHNTSADVDPPIYYDSEPSSQPPKYNNTSSPSSTSATNPRQNHQHRNSAPAATVAAILACPSIDLDAERRANRKRKTIRERWRDFRARNFKEQYDDGGANGASSSEWNVLGAKLGGGVTTPYTKK